MLQTTWVKKSLDKASYPEPTRWRCCEPELSTELRGNWEAVTGVTKSDSSSDDREAIRCVVASLKQWMHTLSTLFNIDTELSNWRSAARILCGLY